MMANQWVLGLNLIFFSTLLFATTYTCLGAQNSTVGCYERERLALLKFKKSVKNYSNVLTSWLGVDCCLWKGVRCDGATRRVVSLHLRGNYGGPFDYTVKSDYYLVGDKVNANLAELTHLKHLDLSGNNFQGARIPEFIGSFKQLSYLNLSNAGFSGIIPHHLGKLSNLKVLDLSSSSSNQMLGSNNMAWVSGLLSLEHLDLSEVNFFQTKSIDVENVNFAAVKLFLAESFNMVFYMIPSLIRLSLRDCGLSNSNLGLPLNSSKILPNVEHLDLSSNFFEGQLPPFFRNMTALTFVDLSNYDLSLVWSALNLLNIIPSLSELRLSNCGINNAHFSPTYFNFSSRSQIRYLDLGANSLEGRFPTELKNMTSLRVLGLSQNSLNSSIPIMPNLLKLDISGNNFQQTELVGIWRHCHLKEVSVSDMYFREEMISGEQMIGPTTNMSECSRYALEVLDSSGSHLKGSIPESLGRLTNLKVLNLASNSLTGSVPRDLERLRSLEVLALSYNALAGPIPTFHRKLTKLYLDGNQFSGSIPESLGRLTSLTDLFLESNHLTGPIPTSLGRLASLKAISVSSNMLNGTIPTSFGKLTKLASLDVSNNSLEGVVSEAHFSNLSMLKYMDLSSNKNLKFKVSLEWIPPFQLRRIRLGACNISDEFPEWLRTQKKLDELVLSNASISGRLPTWLRDMPIISFLDLSHNKLDGPLKYLPLGNPLNGFKDVNIGSLNLQNNLFNGLIPRSLCARTDLEILNLSKNRLTGYMPNCLVNLQNLRMMVFSSNGLSGSIPSSLGRMSSMLSWLNLNNNNFSGELPEDLGELRALRVLDLGENEFSGKIPEWIGEKLTSLMVLRLHKNNLSGRIPLSLCKNKYLQILDIAHNNLTGQVPHCFAELYGMVEASHRDIRNGSRPGFEDNVIQVMKGFDLEYSKTLDLVFNMDLSSNKLVGNIPEVLTTLSLLVGLNLSHNHLCGVIPVRIGNMKSLNSLDLSHNNLTGMIPPSMASLNFLSHLNLSQNNLFGRIPTGNQLQTLTDPSIYAGNRDLCGAPLPKNCSNHEDPTARRSKNKHNELDEPDEWFYLSVACGLATWFWGVIGLLLFKKQWRYKLFMYADVIMDMIYVTIMVKASKMKKARV